MKKRIISGILSVCVAAAVAILFSLTAFAEEMTEELSGETTEVPAGEVPDELSEDTEITLSFDDIYDITPEDLFAGYTQNTINESLGLSPVDLPEPVESELLKYTPRKGMLTEDEQVVYDSLYEQIRQVANGSRSSARFQTPYRSIRTRSVVSALLLDCPYDLYWFDKTAGASIRTGSDYLVFSLVVSSDYRAGNDTYTADTSKTGAAAATVARAQAIVQAAAGRSDVDRLIYYRDWITTNVSYNYDAIYNPRTPYGDPWQIIYVFDGDPTTNVVCEGFSKGLAYLCALTEFNSPLVECYIMNGTIRGGNHMWNIVRMEDGKNYMTDLTSYDSAFPDCAFLAGYTAAFSNGYYFNIAGSDVAYTYNDYTKTMYTAGELEISPTNYVKAEPGDDPAQDEALTIYVTRLYRIVLHRDPDTDGLNQWVTALEDKSMTGADVAREIYLSEELRQRQLSDSDFVEALYRGMFDRASDAGGKGTWLDALAGGQSREAVVAGFANSSEFTDLCGRYRIVQGHLTASQPRDRNIGVTKFVARLYTEALGRSYDEDGLNDWCAQILANPDRENIRNIAANGFFYSEEFRNRNLSDSDYVKCLYRTFLGRSYDEKGYRDWMSRLQNGASRDDVLQGFACSPEFDAIMTGFGL